MCFKRDRVSVRLSHSLTPCIFISHKVRQYIIYNSKFRKIRHNKRSWNGTSLSFIWRIAQIKFGIKNSRQRSRLRWPLLSPRTLPLLWSAWAIEPVDWPLSCLGIWSWRWPWIRSISNLPSPFFFSQRLNVFSWIREIEMTGNVDVLPFNRFTLPM